MDGMGETPQQTAAHAGGAIAKSLGAIRAKAKRRLLVTRVGAIFAALLLAAIGVGLLDYLLRMPMGLRLVLWLGGAAVLLGALQRRVLPVLRFRPSLTEIALKLEQSPAGKAAGLPGVLASGYELAGATDPAHAGLAALRAQAAADAAARFAKLPGAGAALSPAPLRRTLLWLGAAVGPLALLLALTPGMTRIGVERVLTPWTGAAWPKRTMVLAQEAPKAHALGSVYPLRAILAKSAAPRGGSDVKVHFRVITDGEAGPTRESLLTSQNKDAATIIPEGQPGAGQETSGELYERLLDLTSVAPQAVPPDRKIELEYWFESRDDQTEAQRVRLVEAPSLVNASAVVTPPAYAQQALASGTDLASGSIDLGAGKDDRAAIGPVLAGSDITLKLTLNKPLPAPAGEDAGKVQEFLSRTLAGASDATLAGTPAFGATTWTLPLHITKSLRLALHLTDEYGIASTDDTSFKVDVVDDAPPSVTIVEPPADESVLASAVFPAAAEGRDDVAIAWTRLFSQVARPPEGSAGAPADPVGEPAQMAEGAPGGQGHDALTKVRAEQTIDISQLALKPGDELWLTGKAADVFAASGGREPVTSAKRRIRIISDSEFIEQIRAELSGVRESAKRLASTQDALNEKLPQAKQEPSLAQDQARAQAGVQERIAPMHDTIQRLQARVDRNRLGDAGIEGVLADAKTILDAAAQHSDEAQKALQTLSDKNAKARDQAANAAKQAQQGVEDELSNLANLLDRGQDTWAVRRALEKLLIEQKQLSSQTKAAQGETEGKAPESLTPQQRGELADLAKRQRDAARRADAIVDALSSRAQAMSQADQAQAQAMKAAAQKARQQELSKKQNEAAQKIEQNQTGQASKAQEQAQQTIQDLLDELDKGDQKRDEQLKRDLADIRESIERLISVQEGEIGTLAKVVGAGGSVIDAKLDANMLVLNQNTLSVASDARDKVKGGEKLVSLLNSASDSQGAAIVALRASPADTPEADQSERGSLSRLKAALAEAEKLEKDADERDSDRKRADLRKAYLEALELQAAIQADAAPLLGHELSRRERIAARGLGEREQALRATLNDLRSKTQEMEEAKVFAFAHRRLDEAQSRAADSLEQGDASAKTGRDLATSVRLLQELVSALSKDKPKDEFREDDGGGGGGSGSGGKPPLIPPLAELKLLRAMQAEAGELTRTAADAPEEVKAAADLQTQITQQAQELLDRINNKAAPGADEPKPGDAPPDGPKIEPNPGEAGGVKNEALPKEQPKEPTP